MRIWLPRAHLRLVVPFAIAASAVVAVVSMSQGSAEAGGTAQQRVIATATSNGFRVTVRAIRESTQGNEPATATVKIAAFERSGGEWNRLGRALTFGTPSGWFGTWSLAHTVSGG